MAIKTPHHSAKEASSFDPDHSALLQEDSAWWKRCDVERKFIKMDSWSASLSIENWVNRRWRIFPPRDAPNLHLSRIQVKTCLVPSLSRKGGRSWSSTSPCLPAFQVVPCHTFGEYDHTGHGFDHHDPTTLYQSQRIRSSKPSSKRQ